MITKKIKKTLVRAVTLIAVLSMVFTAVSCDKDDEKPERYGEGASDIEIIDFAYGFIEETNYKDRETTVADTNDSLIKLRVDTVYYCLIEFDVIARELNAGTSLLNVLVKFDNLGVINGSTEEAGTGNYTEMVFTDAGTGTDSKVTTLAYKIPSDPDKLKTIKILVRMKPISIGDSHISVSFEAKEYGEFKVLGADGVTKNFEVVRAALDAPVITVDQNKVRWNHVKNAEYYTIYFGDNADIRFDVEENTSAGDELEFSLSRFFIEYGVNFGKVRIQANPGNNTNFSPSNSNVVYDVTIY